MCKIPALDSISFVYNEEAKKAHSVSEVQKLIIQLPFLIEIRHQTHPTIKNHTPFERENFSEQDRLGEKLT